MTINEQLQHPDTVRVRLRRNYAEAAQRANESSGSTHEYHLGRQVAITQSYAEVFNLEWIEADVQLRKGL